MPERIAATVVRPISSLGGSISIGGRRAVRWARAWIEISTPGVKIAPNIENASTSKEMLYNSVEKLNDTWTAAGTIYMSQVNTRSVMTIATDGSVGKLISDPRLRWVDAMWIDKEGFLYMP